MARACSKACLPGTRAAALLLLGATAAQPARAGSIYINGIPFGGSAPLVRPESFQERKFRTTIPQQRDFSCGSAALATLLTYGYGQPVSETQIFASMFENGDRKVITEQGFSLLDMKNYLARRGLRAEGFRAPIEKLAEVGVPAIVLLNVRGYNHFVVVEGLRDGRVLLADPAAGTRSVSVHEFQSQWNGISFIVLTGAGRAAGTFNAPGNWAAAPLAPDVLSRYIVDLIILAQPAGLRDASRF